MSIRHLGIFCLVMAMLMGGMAAEAFATGRWFEGGVAAVVAFYGVGVTWLATFLVGRGGVR